MRIWRAKLASKIAQLEIKQNDMSLEKGRSSMTEKSLLEETMSLMDTYNTYMRNLSSWERKNPIVVICIYFILNLR